MDISLEMESGAPVQLDALMGYVNAVQEMILYSSEKLVKLLPALPDNMSKGKIDVYKRQSNMFGSDDMLRYISIALCVCGGIRYVGFSFLCITSNLFSNEEYFIFVSILFTS